MIYQIDHETGKFKTLVKVPPFFAFLPNSVKKADSDEYRVKMLTEQERKDVAANASGVPMQAPMKLSLDGNEWWTLPYEPIVTVNGKNVIVKKQVAKGKVRGSIKERWSQDDYQISISGILMNPDGTGYPDEDVMQLRRFCEAAKVEVRSPLLEIFSIDKMVIENFDFPFTSGPNNQAYNITACSDDIYKLLLMGDDLKVQ